ncbi:hypothetical protein FPOAC2_07492 [Fusarium poae]|uniref:hypothetical protein n=1 Tax=Fusarium poae TaxID=36050 RepID=UPI001CEAEDA0|nr:hypothetical protein FPOAC1_010090 [Fusarium poae]KAG8670657.1 hypothetical protein FPOAC1_010090 [Fusarium poae]
MEPLPMKYSPKEISTIILDFYTFLTTIYFNPKDLKTPPPDGWPGLEPFLNHVARSDEVGEVMKQIPYFEDPESQYWVHYKSRLINYPTLPEKEIPDIMDWRVNVDNELWSKRRETLIDLHDVFPLALGHETGGRHLWLNVRDGEITDEENKFQQSEPEDIKDYFDGLKQAYRDLTLIPCPGKVTIEVQRPVDELPEGRIITEEEVIAQQDEWETDLDVQYIRQLYRGFGWPDAFRKEEAFRAVNQLMEKLPEHRFFWEDDDY